MDETKDAVRNILADFTSQMQANTRAFREKVVEIQRKFEEPIRPFLELQKHLEETIKPWIEIPKQIAKLHEEIHKLPQRTKNVLMILGIHGWYLDIEMPFPGLWTLEKAINDSSTDEANQALMEYFRKRTPEIEKFLIKTFPHRAKILCSAFKAHSRGEYDLSVPVFLAQADGICQELIGMQLFQKIKKAPAIAKYIETLAADTFQAAMLHPLSVTLPISASKYERADTFMGLNRHQVLHGESTEYGTELNSLKAISLLNYIAQVLRDRKV
jgi:hypothetical protein